MACQWHHIERKIKGEPPLTALSLICRRHHFLISFVISCHVHSQGPTMCVKTPFMVLKEHAESVKRLELLLISCQQQVQTRK